MASKTYEAILGIVDKYSAPILKMEEKLRHLGAVGEATNKMMTPHQHLFANLSEDLAGIGEKFGKVGESIGEMGARVTELVGPLAAIGAAGSLAGLVEMTHSFAESAEQLSIGAKIAGTTVQTMQVLDYAATQTGVATDALQHSLGMLNRNLGSAGAGKDKALVQLLDHLHISLRDTHGQIIDATTALPALADAFAHTTDPAMRALMAQQLFGRAGLELLPLLEKGRTGLAEYTAAFQRYGYVLSDQDVDAGEKFNETWKNMQAAIGGLSDDIAAKLAPVLTPVIQSIADWTTANRNWIATNLQSALQGVSNTLRAIDFKAVLTGMGAFAKSTWSVVQFFGGLKTVMIATGAIMAGPLLLSIVAVSRALAALAVSVGGPIVAALLELGSTIVAVVPMIDSMAGAMAAFDLVLDANPIGILIVAVAALGVAGYELYEHWATVSKKLAQLWDVISTDFMAGWAPQNGMLEQTIKAAWEWAGGWDGIKTALANTWNTVESDFNAVFGPIMAALQAFEEKLQELEGFAGFGGAAPAIPGGLSGPRASRQMLSRDTGGFSSLLDSGSGGGAGGSTDVNINFNNLPPGATVTTKSNGGAPMPKVNTGKTRMSGWNN